MHKLFKDGHFIICEKLAWNSCVQVSTNFLGSTTVQNNNDLVENLLQFYERLDVTCLLKVHFLHSHLDFFPENCGAVSDKYEERFHQEISTI